MGLEPQVFFGRSKIANEQTDEISKNDFYDQNDLVNGTLAKISNSGNSDVDVNTKIDVYIDVMPIAFAILYSSLAKKQISKNEFENAIKKLNEYKSK